MGIHMSGFDFNNGVPQGEITVVNAIDYATVRLADGTEITIGGNGAVMLADGTVTNVTDILIAAQLSAI
jgi:hypothetical protein